MNACHWSKDQLSWQTINRGLQKWTFMEQLEEVFSSGLLYVLIHTNIAISPSGNDPILYLFIQNFTRELGCWCFGHPIFLSLSDSNPSHLLLLPNPMLVIDSLIETTGLILISILLILLFNGLKTLSLIYRPCHSVWKNDREPLYVAQLHENWTRVWFRN